MQNKIAYSMVNIILLWFYATWLMLFLLKICSLRLHLTTLFPPQIKISGILVIQYKTVKHYYLFSDKRAEKPDRAVLWYSRTKLIVVLVLVLVGLCKIREHTWTYRIKLYWVQEDHIMTVQGYCKQHHTVITGKNKLLHTINTANNKKFHTAGEHEEVYGSWWGRAHEVCHTLDVFLSPSTLRTPSDSLADEVPFARWTF